MKYKVDDRITYSELKQLFKEMDKGVDVISASDAFHYSWRTENKDKISIKNSIFITVRKNGRLIGLVRVVTDKAYFYYISDVMVIPEMRGGGIGKELMIKTLEYCKKDGFMKILLSALPNKENWYKQFGFKETMCNHYEIKYKEVEKKIEN